MAFLHTGEIKSMDVLDYNRGRLRQALQTIIDVRHGLFKQKQLKYRHDAVDQIKRLLLCLDMAAKYRNKQQNIRKHVSLSYNFAPSDETIDNTIEYNLNKIELTITILNDINMPWLTAFQTSIFNSALESLDKLYQNLKNTTNPPKKPVEEKPSPVQEEPKKEEKTDFDPIPYVANLWQAISSLWQTQTQSELKRTYHTLARKHHPDFVGGTGAHPREIKYAEEVMKILHNALDLIKQERNWP